jgi:lysosomal Pro-X carboxypeptidase
MLASWFRMRCPACVVGAIAASAPILQFTGLTPPQAWNQVVTRTWAGANPNAPQAIWNSWAGMTALANSAAGRATIQNLLRVCSPLNSPGDVTNDVFNWVSNAISYMTMADYPYPANFLGPMPGYPVNVSAAYLPNAAAPIQELLAGLQAGLLTTFYNYTGQAGACYNLSNLMPPGLQVNGWGYQSCTEMVMPIGQYGWPTDMFWVAPWSLPEAITGCQQQYNGTTPRPFNVMYQYGVNDLRGASNIFFSNGNLDPWSSGGVTANVTGQPSIIAYVIEGGAHHLDLRASNPADPASVVTARAMEVAAIRSWCNDYYTTASIGARV